MFAGLLGQTKKRWGIRTYSSHFAPPWRFSNPTWERSFQAGYLGALQQNVPFLVLLALPFSFRWLSDVASGMVALDLDLLVSQASHDLLLRALPVIILLLCTLVTRKAGQGESFMLFRLATHVLLASSAVGLVGACEDEWKQLELLLRCLLIAAIGIATYEELVCWLTVLIAGKTAHGIFTESTSSLWWRMSLGIMGCACAVELAAMYLVLGRKRMLWSRAIALCTHFSSSGRDGGREPREGWHDDYFTKEEWESVAAQVLQEGAAMIRRVAYRETSRGLYQWIYTDTRLGAGSQGVVRLVRHRSTGVLCAIKVISHDKREGVGASMERSDGVSGREGTLLRMLKHPNIVRFVDQIPLEDSDHLVMELCEGGSLKALITAHGALDMPTARWFTRNILDGLQLLHRHAICHQDLKPSNCLLARMPGGGVCVKLADFGLGGWKEDGARSMLVGTAAYMAPEHRDKFASRRRMDVWSLGACVVEMTAGVKLLGDGGSDRSEVMAQLAALAADPPLPPDVPLPARRFISLCLRVDPLLRPSALRLAQHRFVQVDHPGPAAPAVQATQRQMECSLGSVGLDARMRVPRQRRGLAGMLAPLAWYWWMVELEKPFQVAEREERFQQEVAASTEHAFRAAHTTYTLMHVVGSLQHGFADHVWQSMFRILVGSSTMLYTWLPSAEFRHRNRDKQKRLIQLLICIRIATSMESRPSWTPIFFAVLCVTCCCLGWTMPEIFFNHALVGFGCLKNTVFDQHLNIWGSNVSDETIDKVVSSCTVLVGCAAVSLSFCIHIRLEQRRWFEHSGSKKAWQRVDVQ